MTVAWDWNRVGRNGYYGYSIKASNNSDEAIKEVMALSTKLDKVIDQEIQDRKAIKEKMQKEKKNAKKKS